MNYCSNIWDHAHFEQHVHSRMLPRKSQAQSQGLLGARVRLSLKVWVLVPTLVSPELFIKSHRATRSLASSLILLILLLHRN